MPASATPAVPLPRPATAARPWTRVASRPLRALALLTVALVGLAACAGEAASGPVPAESVPAGPDEWARTFVRGFMAARVAGDAARAGEFLSPNAARQFTAGEGGLTLTFGDDAGWSLLALEAADADSFEVRVRVAPAAAPPFEELLFVGPGPGPDGAPRDLTVRGAQREPADAGDAAD